MRFPALVLASTLAACAAEVRPPAVPPSSAPISGGLDDAAIRDQAAALADGLSINGGQRAELMARLDELLADEDFKAASANAPVRAVGVYRYGAGGFVVKLGRGDGRIRVVGSDADQPFVIDLRGAGAMVGGSASWGVVLALGLGRAADLEGKYAGAGATATALDESTGAMRMDHRTYAHELWLVGIGEGLSANAGHEGLRFSFGTPK